MMVTGIVTAIVLSFKYVSVLGELRSANLTFIGDFRCEVLQHAHAPGIRAGSDFWKLSAG